MKPRRHICLMSMSMCLISGAIGTVSNGDVIAQISTDRGSVNLYLP